MHERRNIVAVSRSAALALLFSAVLMDSGIAQERPVIVADSSSAHVVQTRPQPHMQVTALTVSFAQASSADWIGGGPDYVAMNCGLMSNRYWTTSPLALKTVLSLRLGATYVDDTLSGHALRVTDNELFIEGMVSIPLGLSADPFVAASVRSSVTESFAHFGASRLRTAKIWDPVSTQQAAGIAFSTIGPKLTSTVRLGVTLAQVRAEHHTGASDDPRTVDVREQFRAQSGIELVGDLVARLDSTLTYTGRHSLGSSYEDMTAWNVRSESSLQLQVWKVINVTLGLAILHDIRTTRRTQWRQSLLVGIVHPL